MKLEDLLRSINTAADEQWRELDLERMYLTRLLLKMEQPDRIEHNRLENVTTHVESPKFPGSEGEHLLQEKYQTKDRATRFYNKQVFDKLNQNMLQFIAQTDLNFVSTWGKAGLGCNIHLNEENSYIINSNTIIIKANNYHTLRNIDTNPNITLYYINFLDKRVGLHINGKARVISGVEIVMSSRYPGQNLYGITGESIPLELINKAKIDVEGYWFVITTEECYIHCSKHILAHTEIAEKIVNSRTSELSTLELLEQNILNAEMFVIATADRHGETDCSLRAGPSGFIEIRDGKIRYPEYRGNGVLASLGNITENPEVAIYIFNLCSVSEQNIFIKGKAKILEEDLSFGIDNIAKKAIERWIEIEPIEIQVRQERSRPLYQRIKDSKVPWGTDDDRTKKTGYFITPTDPQVIYS
jgi:hypothetical protein